MGYLLIIVPQRKMVKMCFRIIKKGKETRFPLPSSRMAIFSPVAGRADLDHVTSHH